MAYAMDWKKILIISALLLAPLALTNCGSAGENNSASNRVGPVGPTYPNKLYFDLTVETIVVIPNGTVTFTVRVWDSLGNMAGGVSVIMAGTTDSATGVTDTSGVYHAILKQSGGAGTIVHVTATVENMSLTIPVQVVPTGR
jgi:hypothetical protein